MNFTAIRNLYSPVFAASVIAELARQRYSGWRLFGWIWRTQDYKNDSRLSDVQRPVAVLLGLAMLAQLSVGIALVVDWVRYGTVGALPLGLALILSYPLLWAHVVVVLAWVWSVFLGLLSPKKTGRAIVCTILEWQVRQLRARHKFKVVTVNGSIGKTSTKLAIANLLEHSGLRVQYQAGNYNDRVTVPLVFFGLDEPGLYNVFAWVKVFSTMQAQIAMPYPYDVVVVELGTDAPGMIADFAYLKPDLSVVTGVAPEHMEYFGTLDAVAAEELAVFDYAKQVLLNADDVPGKYVTRPNFIEYGLQSRGNGLAPWYSGFGKSLGLKGQELTVYMEDGEFSANIRYMGTQGVKIALAAIAAADMLGVKGRAIRDALPKLSPFSGRMQILDGVKNSTLIDDTYNAAPISVKAALDVLYAAKAKQRIAILGSMNELGDYSKEAHVEVGEYCNPKKLDVVVTVGRDAKQWLAPAARERGCHVQTFLSPYEAGDYVSGKLKNGGVVLAKGSQNGVFTEEALKVLLADPTDAAKLVRQSPHWMNVKRKQFPRSVE